jgi:hypothetical protein
MYPYMPTRPVTLVTGCDGSEMGCCANYPFARHRAAPPDAVQLAWALYICARALFLPWLRHCLSRMGCGQPGKVSKTVNSCAALLRCVANAYEKDQNSLHTTRVQDIAVRCTHRFVQRVHEGKNPPHKQKPTLHMPACAALAKYKTSCTHTPNPWGRAACAR